ncbi:hypothetical protein FOHLNKBM_6319 [Methylobacterium longum]|nr:hypothetical protein FOHLNKBM_6319 [Methylobacterium longum]
MKARAETNRKPSAPPGRLFITSASVCEKPDWVSAQAIPVAAPMISRIAPDSVAVVTSIG